MRVSSIFLFVVLFVYTCTPPPLRICSPGATQACLCSSNISGVQICKDDASGWLSCSCEKQPSQENHTETQIQETSTEKTTEFTPDVPTETLEEPPKTEFDSDRKESQGDHGSEALPEPTQEQEQETSPEPTGQTEEIPQDNSTPEETSSFPESEPSPGPESVVSDGGDESITDNAVEHKIEPLDTTETRPESASENHTAPESVGENHTGPETISEPHPEPTHEPSTEGGSCTYQVEQELQVNPSSDAQNYPKLQWTGTEYGLFWTVGAKLYFVRLSSAGTVLGQAILLFTATSTISSLSVAWTGKEYGVSFDYGNSNQYNLTFLQVSSTGQTLASHLNLATSASAMPSSLAWAGQEFGLVYISQASRSSDRKLLFVRLSVSGAKQNTEISIKDKPFDASLVWTGREYGVSVSDNRISLIRLNYAGIKQGNDIAVPSSGVRDLGTILLWKGSSFGVFWQNLDQTTQLFHQELSSTGTLVGTTSKLVVPYESHAVWTGTEYGVGYRTSNQNVVFVRMSSTGTVQGTSLPISTQTSYHPSLAWNGTEYGVAWVDQRSGILQIYFRRLVCR